MGCSSESSKRPNRFNSMTKEEKNDIDIVKLKAIRIIRIYRYYFFLSRLIFYCEIVRHVFFTLFGSNFSLFLTACKSPAYFLPRRERKSKDKLRFPLQIGGGAILQGNCRNILCEERVLQSESYNHLESLYFLYKNYFLTYILFSF